MTITFVRSGMASCTPAVLDRFGQITPKVLLDSKAQKCVQYDVACSYEPNS